jgi:HK97 family phage major capsid protein
MKTIAERIADAKARREEVLRSLQALTDTAETEGRTFSDDETTTFGKLEAEAETLNKHVDQLETTERLLAKAAQPARSIVVPNTDNASPLPVIQMRDPKVEKGVAFARFAMALAASRGNLMQAAEIAKRWKDSTPGVETVLKAAVAAGTTSDTNWAKPLVDYRTMASEFIDLLRPATIVGQINGFRRVPFNVRMALQTAGSTAAWVGEGSSKPVSKLAFDQVTIPEAKMAVIVVITEELARFSDPSAEVLVRNDLVEAISAFMDQQFIDPTVAVSAGLHPGAVTNGVTPIPSSGATIANITADLASAVGAMQVANVAMRAPVWVMHPRTKTYLSLLRGTMDTFVFGQELAGNRLLGIPVVTSTSMPVDTSGGSGDGQTSIVLMDAAEILLADDGQVMLDSSREAAIQMDSAPATPATPLVSLWQQNLLALKAERYIWWQRRRAPAVQVISGVAY